MESQVVCLRVLSAFVQLGDSVNISLVSYIPSVCPGLIDWPVQDGSRLLSIGGRLVVQSPRLIPSIESTLVRRLAHLARPVPAVRHQSQEMTCWLLLAAHHPPIDW